MESRDHKTTSDSGVTLHGSSVGVSSVLIFFCMLIALGAVLVYSSPQNILFLFAGSISIVSAIFAKQKLAKSRFLFPRDVSIAKSAIWGAVSCCCEFTTTIFVWFVISPITVDNIVAVGYGAAVGEILYLIVSSVHKDNSAEILKWQQAASRSFVVRHMFMIERSVATIGHVSTRCLLFAGVDGAGILPILVASVAFALTDGIAIYGRVRGWDWYDDQILFRFYLITLILAIVESIYAFHLLQQ